MFSTKNSPNSSEKTFGLCGFVICSRTPSSVKNIVKNSHPSEWWWGMLQYQKFQLVLFLQAHNEACKKKKNALCGSSHGKNEWQEILALKETANLLVWLFFKTYAEPMSLIKNTWPTSIKHHSFLYASFVYTTKLQIDYYFFKCLLTKCWLCWDGWANFLNSVWNLS